MEGWGNTVLSGKQEFIGHFIYLPQDGERTYVAGTQLLAGQTQAYVSSGEPHSIPWMVKRGISMMDVRLYLLASDCLLQVDMS